MTTLLEPVRKCKGSGIIVTVLNDYDITVTNISKQRIRCNNTAVPVFIENTSLSKDDTVGRYGKNCFVLLKLKKTGEWRLGCSVFISGWFDMSLFLVWNMACPIVDLLLPDRVHTNYILNFMDVLPIENKCYELHFLNRASTGVFGHYMKDDIVNKLDGGLQMSVKGPDHFFIKNCPVFVKDMFKLQYKLLETADGIKFLEMFEQAQSIHRCVTKQAAAMIESEEQNMIYRSKQKRKKRSNTSSQQYIDRSSACRFFDDPQVAYFTSKSLSELVVSEEHDDCLAHIEIPENGVYINNQRYIVYWLTKPNHNFLIKNGNGWTIADVNRYLQQHYKRKSILLLFDSCKLQNGLMIRYSNAIKGSIMLSTKGYPNETEGLMLVRWMHAPLFTHVYRFDKKWYLRYKKAFKSHNVKRTFINDGQQIYCGVRSSSQASTSVLEGTGRNSDYRYYSASWNTVDRVSVERHFQSITKFAVQFSQYLDPLICSILPGSNNHNRICSIGIFTTGDSEIMGYCNCSHTDNNDKLNRAEINEIMALVQGMKPALKEYINMFQCYVGIGVPTTCAYQILIESDVLKKSDVVVIFIYSGLGCMYKVRDGDSQSFYAHAISHNTAVPFCVYNGNVYYNSNSEYGSIHIVAWGEGKKSRR